VAKTYSSISPVFMAAAAINADENQHETGLRI
jgi:hypothetical protein